MSDASIAELTAQISAAFEQHDGEQLAALSTALLELRPGHRGARQMLANAKLWLDELDEAEAILRKLVDEAPEYALAWSVLAEVHERSGYPLRAVAAWRIAVHHSPEPRVIPRALAYRMAQWDHHGRAEALFREWLTLEPNDPELHFNLALSLLSQGKWEEGFREYEWRWQLNDFVTQPMTSPRWCGEPLTDKTVILQAEQGLGDAFMGIRFAADLAARGAQVIIRGKPKLNKLLKSAPGVARVSAGKTPPRHDFHIPMLSVPGVLGLTPDSVPAATPYLHITKRKRNEWRRRLNKLAPKRSAQGKRIGLVWRSVPISQKRRNINLSKKRRSIDLDMFDQLFELPDTRFFALQVDTTDDERARLSDHDGIDLSPQLTDFIETAACLEQLDLVISIDTAVAHLAGALHRPVWTLVTHSVEWRWQIRDGGTGWYPSMRFFRQPSIGKWEPLIAELGRALTDFVLGEEI